MSEPTPALDVNAVRRWHALPRTASPWLHEEIARRMQERLSVIQTKPKVWTDWEPVLGGLQGHLLVRDQIAASTCYAYNSNAQAKRLAQNALTPALWKRVFDRHNTKMVWQKPPDDGADMVWANMALHIDAHPQELIRQWYNILRTDGFLMFSCLGPDTLKELRQLYTRYDWGPIGAPLIDMHDWGDALLQQGFSDPVVDMEYLELTYTSAERLLQDLREIGKNFSPTRFQGLRTRAWSRRLLGALDALRSPQHNGAIVLTFEIVYGHAFKLASRPPSRKPASIPLAEVRAALHKK